MSPDVHEVLLGVIEKEAEIKIDIIETIGTRTTDAETVLETALETGSTAAVGDTTDHALAHHAARLPQSREIAAISAQREEMREKRRKIVERRLRLSKLLLR